jgi:RNA recognition motif-containing protein
VRGPDDGLTEKSLERVFRGFGQIQNLKVQRDENEISRKFGQVGFRNLEDAQECIGAGVFDE